MKWLTLWRLLESRGVDIDTEIRRTVQDDYEHSDDAWDWLSTDNGEVDTEQEDVEGKMKEVTRLTVHILDLEWTYAVYKQTAGGELFRDQTRRSELCDALGYRADLAIQKGVEEFAAGFSDENCRNVFLNGTDLECARETP